MPHSLTITAVNAEKMNKFLKAAMALGIDRALPLHGDGVNQEEAIALKELKPGEIEVLYEISESILSYLRDYGDDQSEAAKTRDHHDQ